ncbi:ABC transporter ATP-binding protein [Lactobacillus sp. ESL0680]|uniref:ATP-binding cassette domain-containing protein n=1 Tax=Lactobacillus sp. ESL0680 TaxID=2983210 RepID=UPI0023F6F346|nr:ABC transporter ATP-binding protein [Lactobacillus sp. ESL0680]WEV39158.1 ABC transporter ATP-binding protein [Lactobacillus sp. ESL0680]
MNVVTLENVEVQFRKNVLLTNVNLTVNAGDLILLNGDNGTGKSTLLKVICGLLRPNNGKVSVFNQELSKGKFASDTAVMINAPQFIGNYSGLENLCALARIKHKIDASTVKQYMKLVGLDPENKTKVKKYSLGMNQKLGLAQALMEDEKLILLDEPLNGLDKTSKIKLINLITKIHHEKPDKTWIIVSHDDSFNEICNRKWQIKDKELSVSE